MRTASSWLPLLLMVATGCYASDVAYTPDYGDGAYDGSYAANAGPEMVDVSPGVQVMADYDYPVFYSGGMYWRNYGGAWYSSNVYNGGWALSADVPYGVGAIRDPGMYAHYRGGYGGGYRGGYAGGYRGGYGGPNQGGYQGGFRGNAGGYRPPANVGYHGPVGGGGFRPGTYRGEGFRAGGAPAYHGGGSPGGSFHSGGGGGFHGGGGGRRR